MKYGIHSLIGERGITLSGGEIQRIAIARIFLKNPKILILDEATSALDSESEFYVSRALGNLMSGRTTLIIAHRLSTIKNVDEIIVLDDGKISECGSFAGLIDKDGIFKRLYERQKLSFSSEESN